jgi:single-strand DNA-binding protein
MLNHITIMGRLVRDPELRRTGSGVAVASFRVAVDRDYQSKDGGERKADFIDCVAWRQTGEFVSKYFTKGRMIIVDGRLEMRDWTDKEGNKRTSAEINVANAYFGDSKRDGDNSGSFGGGYSAPASSGFGGYSAPSGAPASDFAMLSDDDAQLPF